MLNVRCLYVCVRDSLHLPTCPTVCVYLNKYGKVGPHLDGRRVQQLPDHFGPGRVSSVLQQCVQACVDCAHNQSSVFSCLKPGHGGEVISGKDWYLLSVWAMLSISFIRSLVIEIIKESLHFLHLFQASLCTTSGPVVKTDW